MSQGEETIMLVEDNEDMGRLMKFLFELEGFHVVATDACDRVLPLLHETIPQVVLMDVHVNGQETFDLVRQMRELNSRIADTLVVMTSAADCRRECMEAGADHFIMKPFLPDEVILEIRDMASRHKMHNTPPPGLGFCMHSL